MNSSVQTLRHSYGSIIKSLVQIHNRRAKKKKAATHETYGSGFNKDSVQKVNFLTTIDDISPDQAAEMQSCLENADKYDMERFINPVTREDTFKKLFAECEKLNTETQPWRTAFFDAAGNFLSDKFRSQSECTLDRTRFNRLKLWCKKLSSVMDNICRNYNDDLLNMFRLD